MRILGIDPGMATTGYGIIEATKSDEFVLLAYGLVETDKNLPHGQRLENIYQGISDIIQKHSPQTVAIERLFFATNALTAIAVGQAIGVIKLAIHHHQLPVFDYAPMQIKNVIGGSGKADKKTIKRIVKRLFKIRETKGMRTHFDNSADALAIALCHAKKTFFTGVLLLSGVWGFGFGASQINAIYDPPSVPNNRVGVHILEPSEVIEAAKLVNSTGGDWGYVTIPIRSNDRDRKKWTEFFQNTTKYHLIPIIRLATYPEDATWVTPNAYDLVDFANFLSEMPWPTKNRYLILFNEPNHANEWGGSVDPAAYAALLVQARQIFKSRSDDYFLLTAGLDMSAPTNHTSQDALLFYHQMTKYVPNWLEAVDGLSFHAYPNPGFISSPASLSRYGPTSYRFELKALGITNKYIFITETGHLRSDDFFTPVFTQVWTEDNITAITPFLLFASGDSFSGFSLLNSDRQPRSSYRDIYNLKKVSGSPLLSPASFSIGNEVVSKPPKAVKPGPIMSILDHLDNFFKTISSQTRVKVGSAEITVEIANEPIEQARGLSGRTSLPPNHGMLFAYSTSGVRPFWMGGMLIPLDFIWIRDQRVVFIHQNVLPPGQTSGNPQAVNSPEPVDLVLEVPGGFIQNHGIKIGDEVELGS